MQKRTIVVTTALAGALLAASATGAVAGSLVTSAQIKDNTVRSVDVRDGAVHKVDLSKGVNAALTKVGTNGKDGKDGVSNLITGAGYTSTWEAGEYGETVETCPTGQYAIGGGYSMWGGYGGTHDSYDLGGTNKDIQVTVSAPYFKGEYVPVDEAGNFRADQWVVRGYNHGTTDQIVRAWVTCANVAD